ncbi:unnamed protein product [Brachionus calyciflorus]|uniref:Hypoxia up-regulated protein 1 n=1 Tax=Brachionus calyciflorus TaxID=104777 RepID=A0A814AEN3_9BILA|nr:unnamed protein product [Brachionus calyciflorus]
MRFGILVLLKILLVTFLPHVTESVAVMSVDLGSEFMKIAIVKPGIPMEIVLNKESRRKTPLVVSIKGDDRQFGEMALQQSIKNPKTAYVYLTQILGKSLDNPDIQSYIARYPFYNIKEDPVTKTIYFQHDENLKFTPEELLAMILEYARELAADFAEQAVDAAVLTVPPYFNQAERKAVLRAAEIANIKVLQLINTNIAAGLNYGVFRRKDFNSTGSNLMFFDMGGSGTTVTIATFLMVKNKDDYEANPQLTVRGVGFARGLGGQEFTLRLAKHLAKLFNEKNKRDVYKNPKAIMKIYKEAERVKNILSANTETMAQIENVMDDIDFKVKVSRSEFEDLCSDLFERIEKTVQDAVKSAELVELTDLTSVVLVGASTRIPRVQAELLKATKKSDLGKFLNTDEAPALGAVYQAAYQSKGYKVKKFYIKDVNTYPICVDFEKYVAPGEEKDPENNSIRRVLFDKLNPFPQKKVMTFSRHVEDFGFSVNYGDLSFLSQDYVKTLGSLNLSQVQLHGVKDIYEKHLNEETKGIKVHFRLDDSGILRLDKIDIVFEKQNAEPTTEESTLSKLGNKISSFFSNGKSEETTEEEKGKDDDTENKENVNSETTTPETTTEQTTTPTPKTNSTNETATNSTESTTTAKNETQIKSQILRENINFDYVELDLIPVDKKSIEESRKILSDIKEKEKAKRKRAAAVNALEAYIFDLKDKLHQDEFVKCSTTEEREKISAKVEEVDNWLSDADNSVETKEFQEKLNELKSSCKDVTYRINEKKLRPKKLDELKDVLNKSTEFLSFARNLTGEDLPLTETEFNSLDKLINSTKEWRVKMLNEQAKVADNEQPKLLSTDISDKIDELKREVSYLSSKIKYFRPKKKPSTEEKNKKNTTSKDKEETDKKESENQESTTTEAPDQQEAESTGEENETTTEANQTESTNNPEL